MTVPRDWRSKPFDGDWRSSAGGRGSRPLADDGPGSPGEPVCPSDNGPCRSVMSLPPSRLRTVTLLHSKAGRITRMVESADATARRVWDWQSVWSQAADTAKKEIGRARAAGLALGITAAAL